MVRARSARDNEIVAKGFRSCGRTSSGPEVAHVCCFSVIRGKSRGHAALLVVDSTRASGDHGNGMGGKLPGPTRGGKERKGVGLAER